MRYPTLDELLTLHQLALDAYGGAAGLRDLGALQSALATPRQVVFGEELYPTLADKAAILLYLLVQNHPFVDGNKRTALSACFWFLESNGYTLSYKHQASRQHKLTGGFHYLTDRRSLLPDH